MSVAFSEWWFCFVWLSPGSSRKVCLSLFHQMMRHQGWSVSKSFIGYPRRVIQYLAFGIFSLFTFYIFYLTPPRGFPRDWWDVKVGRSKSFMGEPACCCLPVFRKSIESCPVISRSYQLFIVFPASAYVSLPGKDPPQQEDCQCKTKLSTIPSFLWKKKIQGCFSLMHFPPNVVHAPMLCIKQTKSPKRSDMFDCLTDGCKKGHQSKYK